MVEPEVLVLVEEEAAVVAEVVVLEVVPVKGVGLELEEE